MNLLLHVAVLLARNRLWLLLGCIIFPFLVAGAPGRRRAVTRTLIVGIGLGIFFGGPLLSGWIVYRMGETATAQVVGTYRTSTRINGRDVMGYKILIHDARGDIFASRFEDDEFNVYPPTDFSYPRLGESFGVRMLPGFLRDFVIRTDDRSPWMLRQRCDARSVRLSDAEQRFNAAQGAEPFRMPYAAAIDAYLAQDCAGAEPGPESFRQDRARALAGQLRPAE